MAAQLLAAKSTLGQNKIFHFTDAIHHDTYQAIDSSLANLSGKAVLITGASRGIGKAIALSFARAGASFIAIAARSTYALGGTEFAIVQAASSAGKTSPRVLKVTLDVMEEEAVANLAVEVEKAFGKLDILVNNAGVMEKIAGIMDSDPKDWWNTWIVNIRGPYLVTRALLPLMIKSGEKIILNVSSVGAHTTFPGGSAYQSTKFALLRFTEFIQAEYGDQGILPIAYHPGDVATDMGLSLPEEVHGILIDTPELAGDTIVWLTKERRPWLSGRYVSCAWDMPQLEARRDEIVKEDKLRVRMAV